MKRIIDFFSIICIVVLTSFNIPPTKSPIVKTVVIDAGHGGHDPGCLGSKTKEKNITLAIALKLGSLIEKNFPQTKVIYTRKTDVFVEIYKRAQIANNSNADLFISIHCNANPSKNPYGAETYVMGLHKSQANLEVAQKENASILMEENYSTNYDGFDPNSTEAYIVFSLYQNVFLEQSLLFSTKIQNQMKNYVGFHDRGVKQAGFIVLYKTAMPSILLEAGFLSNLKDEQFLLSEKGIESVSTGLFKAFKEYKLELEGDKKTINTIDTVTNKTTTPYQLILNESTKLIKDSSLISTKKDEIVFKIQFLTSTEKKPLTANDFKNIDNVQEYFQNGLYKYVTGNEKTFESALVLLKKIHEKGFKDAFIVAYLNNKRISPQDAVKLIKKE